MIHLEIKLFARFLFLLSFIHALVILQDIDILIQCFSIIYTVIWLSHVVSEQSSILSAHTVGLVRVTSAYKSLSESQRNRHPFLGCCQRSHLSFRLSVKTLRMAFYRQLSSSVTADLILCLIGYFTLSVFGTTTFLTTAFYIQYESRNVWFKQQLTVAFVYERAMEVKPVFSTNNQ